jgi:2-(1,2-epoxy-1,2-dihydrophenyl)acetyl-CoA isomerase
MTEPLLIDRDGAVVTLTMNRPDALNALDVELKVGLREALRELAADRSCRAIVLAGAGRAFCVGQDLREHQAALGSASADPLATVADHYNPLVRAAAAVPQPMIAAVRGTAAGAGASLALLCDLRVFGPGSRLLMAFANVGLTGDTGISYTLPRLVGRARAAELLLLAEPVDAATADRYGLVTRLAPSDDEVLPVAVELASRLAAGPTVAYAAIKRQLAVDGTLEDALAAEAEAQRISGLTADHRNATAAFVAKRRPVFEGR